MHGKQFNRAVWIAPSSLKVAGREVINLAGGSTLAGNLEFILTATSPLNATALKAAAPTLEAIYQGMIKDKDGKDTDKYVNGNDIFEVAYPVINVAASEKVGVAKYNDESVVVFKATRANMIAACKAVIAANEAQGKADAGQYFAYSAYRFMPLAEPTFDVGNDAATERGKRAGKSTLKV